MSREEFAPPITAEERDRNMLVSARDTEIENVVRREQAAAARKGMPLTAGEAKTLVLERIGTDGIENVLPIFARMQARMGGQLPPEPERKVQVRASTLPGQG